jgi:DNA polymerase-3 subunit chi
MTEITFHFNAPDALTYTHRLLRTVVNRGLRVCVLADGPTLDQLDRSLWSGANSGANTEFWAHCRADASPAVVLASLIVLGLADCPVLVNLGTQLPDGFERFERLNEIVGLDDTSRQAGRQRWKHYADRGYSIKKHEVKG